MIPVIIPGYKKQDQLDKCIAHLKAQTVEAEIFIRDNSIDNVYFTRAINEGIRKYLDKDCEYILLLNQDMYLEPNTIEEMVKFMDSHPQCGIGTPLQLHSENPDYVVYAGGLDAFPFGRHQQGPLSKFTKDEQLFWGNGACMILRKKMIREIGLLDKNLVFIGSDSDYCFTARSRGWQVWRIANARGVHEHGASGAVPDAEMDLLKIKDMLYFGKKWLTGRMYRELSYEGKNCMPEVIDTPGSVNSTDSKVIPVYTYRIINTYPHDRDAFTQGLIYENGFLYEGTGLNKRSTLRRVELETGNVIQLYEMPGQYFGEGITIFEDRIIQLTWQAREGFVYDKESFESLQRFDYQTEGWGITHDGKQLIMSDGTANLYFWDPETFVETGRIKVFDADGPVSRLNELEYVNGEIFANIWQSNRIARISPLTGEVVGWIDLQGLLSSEDKAQAVDVLNGIAYDAAGERLFVTGKLWPKLFEIVIVASEK